MNKENVCYHTPVLLEESLNGLNIQSDKIYVDVTFGGGGHSRGILEGLGRGGKLYGFDQDMDAEVNIPKNDPRFIFVRSNFRYMQNFMRYHGVSQIDGLFADLGVSSHHFDDETRGFSFRFDGILDMRMNNRSGKTAAEIVNQYSEESLANLFYFYGELKNARKIAAAIVQGRKAKPIETITGLLHILEAFAGRGKEKKFLAQVFQALRIEVNDELEALRSLLLQAKQLLKPGGRLVVITYHSLEDRLVKNFFRTGDFDGKSRQDFYGNVLTPFRLINNKVITPSAKEIEANPRARSAKLRIAEKLKDTDE
ncbi:MAG: 16S rRNA (cytosine(1402)-N(4))-methyltransferase RsmH [Tannerella sp.]|jgi:16S rRNA (cytosine1402-N4)-methyltransferase|nr:16S rRNA (cytosine(1402)-N(4))-methyltransferase RsmH [Tannerella sp.]